jgi:hypothetical protein
MANKGTKGNIPSYPELHNTTLLFFTLGMFLIAVQTNVPSIKTRKTFPGCVRSFSGYPFEGTGDDSSLHYLSCIVYAIRKNSADPWSSIKNTKETAIATKIKNAIDLLLLLPSVKTKIDEKTKMDEINAHIYNISVMYNIDKKNIIKNFFNYIIRNKPTIVNSKFLSFVENIMHVEEYNNKIYVNHSLNKLSSFF